MLVYIGNHKPALPDRTPGGPKIASEWTWSPKHLSQVNDLLLKIKDHKEVGVTGASMVYSWIGRLIQPLQKRVRFDFEYLGIADPSRFIAYKIHQDEAVRHVSRVLLDAETVPYVPKLLNVKNSPKQVGVRSYHLMSSTFKFLILNCIDQALNLVTG